MALECLDFDVYAPPSAVLDLPALPFHKLKALKLRSEIERPITPWNAPAPESNRASLCDQASVHKLCPSVELTSAFHNSIAVYSSEVWLLRPQRTLGFVHLVSFSDMCTDRS